MLFKKPIESIYPLIKFAPKCALLAFLALNCLAENRAEPAPVKIHGFSLEYRLTDDGENQYNLLFNEIKKAGLQFDLQVKPLKRALKNFLLDGNNSCIFPTSINATLKHQLNLGSNEIIASSPIDRISLRVFTRPDQPTIKNIEELNNKKVAVWSGMDPKLYLKGINATIQATPDEVIRVKMLNAGRLDAILGFTPDIILTAIQLDLPEPHFDENLALFKDEGASIVCKKTEETAKFLEEFDALLQSFKDTGKLVEILGKNAEIAY